MKKNIMLMLLLIIVTASCNKNAKIKKTEPVALPPITEVGANASGCTIGGINYVAYGSTKGGYPGPSFTGPNTVYNLWGAKDMEFYYSDRWLRISIPENPLVGDNSDKFYSEMKIQGQVQYYELIESKPRNLIISNFSNNIIAGTFDFWLVNDRDSNDFIHITNGRFDLRAN